MQITDHHALYYAYELNRAGGDGLDRISRALFDASVDMNPHQINAALFALRSPISKGVLLADEVGLGKTIEAGLVLCQRWAERRRRLLVICPASLRRQWDIELAEKFNLPSSIIDTKTVSDLVKNEGLIDPFLQDKVIICSYNYAFANRHLIQSIDWDLVVIDEAHKLRNCYKSNNKIGQGILKATEGKRKILLTATPLQNSLLELYGLTSLIDSNIFGGIESFKSQYIGSGGELKELKERISTFCWRTLRKHVLEYIKYTNRIAITKEFTPADKENTLYNLVSAYLQRDDTYGFPASQRRLLILLVRKVLASSSVALTGTLRMVLQRLQDMLGELERAQKGQSIAYKLPDEGSDIWILEEDMEHIYDSLDGDSYTGDTDNDLPITTASTDVDLSLLRAEIAELSSYIELADSIKIDSKAQSLLEALGTGFDKMAELGAAKKAVIFTESKRTQEWLARFLAENGYAGEVVTFSGTNTGAEAKKIYDEWLEKNKHTSRITGSRPIDIRTAIIDKFRDNASILIATEAGAEGLNLQFCSLVVNYDLPWNPQRIEQRIGRCHRYGQKHDVVVINFLNKHNEADRRVYNILSDKFKLFEGVFGSSDSVLGSLATDINFEKEILNIYQQCRSPQEIEAAFASLQEAMDAPIKEKMAQTHVNLIEHFDEDVHKVLKLDDADLRMGDMERMFWDLTKHILGESAQFNDDEHSFRLHNSVDGIATGTYFMIRKNAPNDVSGQYLYRLNHPLGEYVVNSAKSLSVGKLNELTFDISNHPAKISVIEQLKGCSGYLSLQLLTVDSFERDEHLIFSAFDDKGEVIPQDTCEKFFKCVANSTISGKLDRKYEQMLASLYSGVKDAILAENNKHNLIHFDEIAQKLDKWAEDQCLALSKELETLSVRTKELKRKRSQAQTLEDKLDIEREVKQIDKERNEKRRRLFLAEDEINERRDRLIEEYEARMTQKITVRELFTIKWKVV